MLEGKKILIGITGSIAAYKSILLVRLLVKEGAVVKVVMTPSARDFVSPLVLSTLSRNKVAVELSTDDSWENHVALGRWADLLLIAPASCNTIAKMAHGLCDNLLLASYLSAICPVMIAPAMDEDMWKHSSTTFNLDLLRQRNHMILPVGMGELASGLTGEGRMAEPELIVASVREHFKLQHSFSGHKVLVTAGPTYEAIDPVRFIGNHSSGKMGIAVAAALAHQGAEVVLVLGPSAEPVPVCIKEVIHVTSADEMLQACLSVFPSTTITVMAAAVADYRPVHIQTEKIKKSGQALEIQLEPTTDILKTIGTFKTESQLLIGFALETDEGTVSAQHKLASKNADAIVLNSLSEPGAGFRVTTNKITIFEKNGAVTNYPLKSKEEAALDIVNTIKRMLNA
jgi:phosphopantothenoylcysteine decarboxylase / phosphopantothenate---cysteine ligase